MKIAIGCDPNAQQAKEELIKFMEDKGYGEIKDFGSEDPIYANTAVAVAEAVASGEYDRGILICGTGLGVSIAANKVKGAYAALLSEIKRRINRRFPDKRIRSGMLFSAKGRCFQRVRSSSPEISYKR